MAVMIRITMLGLLLAVFTACIGPETPQPPEWVQHPPAPTPTERYGVSVANTLPAATLSAAGGIASGLYEESEPLVLRRFDDPARQKEVLSAIKKVLADLDYSRVTVKASGEMEEQTAVMVTLPRQALATQLQNEVTRQTAELQNVLQTASTQKGFAKIGLLGKSYERLPHFYAWAMLLETETGIEPKEAFTTVNDIETAYIRDCFGVPIAVIGDAEAIFLVKTLQHALRARSLDPSGTPVGTILLSAQTQKESSGGRITLRTKLLILAQEGDGTSLAEHTVLLKATDTTLEAARVQSAKQLAQMIDNEGLFRILGF